MKILCPITSAEDIEILDPNLYGTEFFCGYLPHWWIKKYNKNTAFEMASTLSVPINNRNNISSNLTGSDDLHSVVCKSAERSTDVFLVLNAKYYPQYTYADLERYVSEVYSAGIRRMIVCDIGMISYLNEHYPDVRVSVSCLNQVTNSETAGFYLQFPNVERIVFPRHMSTEEVLRISERYPSIDFESFIFSNKCLYDDGYCRGLHEFTPICKDLYYSEFYGIDGSPLPETQIDTFHTLEAQYRRWTRTADSAEQRGYCTANFGCMACAFLQLIHQPNIVSAKMSIRGHDVEERLRQVKMARAALTIAEFGDIERLKKTVSEMYGNPNLCESGAACIMK